MAVDELQQRRVTSICVISFRLQQHPGRDDCHTWPTDRSEVFRIIERYMDCPEAERKQRMVGLAKFARDEEEEKKKKKKTLKTPTPTAYPKPAPAPAAWSGFKTEW